MGEGPLEEGALDHYQSNLGWHSREGVIEALERLFSLDVNTREYWELKSRLVEAVSENAIEQFSRGKHGAGMSTRGHYKCILEKLTKREETESNRDHEDYF